MPVTLGARRPAVFGRDPEIAPPLRGKSKSTLRRRRRRGRWSYGRHMRRLLRDPRVQGAGDVVLALLLAVLSVLPVLGGDPSWGRPAALGLVLALASTVPVAWRSRYPLVAAAIVLVANAGCVFAATPNQAAFQPFVALVLVAYSAG